MYNIPFSYSHGDHWPAMQRWPESKIQRGQWKIRWKLENFQRISTLFSQIFKWIMDCGEMFAYICSTNSPLWTSIHSIITFRLTWSSSSNMEGLKCFLSKMCLRYVKIGAAKSLAAKRRQEEPWSEERSWSSFCVTFKFRERQSWSKKLLKQLIKGFEDFFFLKSQPHPHFASNGSWVNWVCRPVL